MASSGQFPCTMPTGTVLSGLSPRVSRIRSARTRMDFLRPRTVPLEARVPSAVMERKGFKFSAVPTAATAPEILPPRFK